MQTTSFGRFILECRQAPLDIDPGQADEVLQRAERVAQSKLARRLHDSAWGNLPGFLAIFWSVTLGTLMWGHAGAVTGLLVALAVFSAYLLVQLGLSKARHALNLARPLSASTGDECARALRAVERSSAARTLRDVVLGRGEQLRGYHLAAMERLVDEEWVRAQVAQAAAETELQRLERAKQCRELHGLP